MNGRKAYVAGPMRGLPEFNHPAFDACAYYARECGYEVFSPADHDRECGYDWTGVEGTNEDLAAQGFDLPKMMRDDMEWITAHATHIIMLPGWSKSTGAQLEKRVAEAIGCTVLYYDPNGPKFWRLLEDPLADDAAELNRQEFPIIDVSENAQAIADIVYPAEARCYGCPVTDGECPLNCDTIPHPVLDNLAGQAGAIPEEVVNLTANEVRITNQVTGGQKGSKPERYDLIPVEALDEIARVYGFGAQKYDDHNWRKGYDWSLSYAALLRHVTSFWRGETHDPETGLHHLAHAAFHCNSLIVFAAEHPELDDRWGHPMGAHAANVDRPTAKQIKEAEAEECLRSEVEDAELDRWARNVPESVFIEAPEWRANLGRLSLTDLFRTEL